MKSSRRSVATSTPSWPALMPGAMSITSSSSWTSSPSLWIRARVSSTARRSAHATPRSSSACSVSALATRRIPSTLRAAASISLASRRILSESRRGKVTSRRHAGPSISRVRSWTRALTSGVSS